MHVPTSPVVARAAGGRRHSGSCSRREKSGVASVTHILRGHEAEREAAAAGRRAALGGSAFPPQCRTLVLVPGPGVLQLAQHGRTGRHPPVTGKERVGFNWAPFGGSFTGIPLKPVNPPSAAPRAAPVLCLPPLELQPRGHRAPSRQRGSEVRAQSSKKRRLSPGGRVKSTIYSFIVFIAL